MNISVLVKAFSKGLAIFLASSGLLISAEASTIAPIFDVLPTDITKTTPTHAVFLKCKINEKWVYLSKGAILALPESLTESRHDFALVTGHGLDVHADCFVSDFQGNSKKVITKTFAKDYKAGTATDWAIISFKRIKGNHIKRYDIDDYLEDPLSLHNAPISFARARGLPQNSQKCKAVIFTLNTTEKTSPVFSHNCKAIGGQSGSPITQTINGKHKLVGFHLGNMWTLKSPLTGKPGRFNFLRPYDRKMSSEIKHTLSEIE